MKTLLLMRHAKSSWKQTDLPDIDRPLNPRGERDAPAMGGLLKDNELIPDLILSSPAARARRTAELVANMSHYEHEIVFVDKLYMAEPPDILGALNLLPDEITRVLLVAHNPGLEEALQLLTGEVESLPTAAIASISLPIEHWSELNDGTRGSLLKVWRPKESP